MFGKQFPVIDKFILSARIGYEGWLVTATVVQHLEHLFCMGADDETGGVAAELTF